MPSVLIVSYYFPPSGGPGVQRVLKFTKYLPELGWRPLILTVREDATFPALDESLAAEIPVEATVFRSSITEFYDLYRRFTGRRGSGPAVDIDTVQRGGATYRERLARTLRGAFFIPDGRVGWMPGGLRAGRKICRQARPDLILATGPPFTGHWLAARLAREFDLPLVLDFRDPWTKANFYPSRPGWARRLDAALERRCLRRAARVVTVNRQIRDDLLGGDRQLAESDFVVIPNGFDPADFAEIERQPSSRWTIAHVGSIFASRVPNTFLDELEVWLREQPDRVGQTRLRLVGRVCPEMLERVSRSPLLEIIAHEGYLSHRESVQAMVDADLLLLLTNEEIADPGMITGKVFEYLGSGTEILALAPEGEVAAILRETGRGRAVAPQDAPGIRQAVQQLSEGRISRQRQTATADALARFSRPAQAAELAALLVDVLSEWPARTAGHHRG